MRCTNVFYRHLGAVPYYGVWARHITLHPRKPRRGPTHTRVSPELNKDFLTKGKR